MRHVAVASAVFAAVAVTACFIPPPPELCRRNVETTCVRTHECTPEANKQSAQFTAVFGTSADECRTKLEALAGCDAKTTEDSLCDQPLPDGGLRTGKFDLGAARDCNDQRKSQSCQDFLDPAKVPAACAQRCTY